MIRQRRQTSQCCVIHDRTASPTRSGLALVELLLAIAITSMITAAVASMTTAVARSEEYEKDRRESTVRAQALNVRLAGYISPSRCILSLQPDSVVLWFDDSRTSETVHASEIRWIEYESATSTIVLRFVSFPEGWTQLQIDEYDTEFPAESDWSAVLLTYEGLGLVETITLCDRVVSFEADRDASTEQGKKILTFTVTFSGQTMDHEVVSSSSVREYQEPIS